MVTSRKANAVKEKTPREVLGLSTRRPNTLFQKKVKKLTGASAFETAEMRAEMAPGRHLNPLQPKVFGVKFSLREIRSIFLTKIRNFKLFKMPK